MALNRLIEILEQMEAAHKRMLELGEQKKTAIMANDVDRVIVINNQESKIVKMIGALDQERTEAAFSFMQAMGIKSNLNLKLSELTRLVFDVEDKARLVDVQHRLATILQKLKSLNDINQQLTEQSLTFINLSIDLLVGTPTDSHTYTHPASTSTGYRNQGFYNARG
ncbi:flagellar protein FlgN [Saccharibacillus brassicae]|uniref:Flagellar protein FlgN n=1 Tax=Saccharibacillus brassicae TaxID=2583377 RepID=A0A4Y6UX46_SACBS|nr:flagellar protein FlgN [Saccharibacillus brassicae]QDH20857.1 flagellar protein FlgN [Saccharibacillus brassicae]